MNSDNWRLQAIRQRTKFTRNPLTTYFFYLIYFLSVSIKPVINIHLSNPNPILSGDCGTQSSSRINAQMIRVTAIALASRLSSGINYLLAVS